jgi:hypothetical protein
MKTSTNYGAIEASSVKLNYLEKSTCPDMAYAAHQCARFASNLKKGHGIAIKHIGLYLLNTKEEGITCIPNDDALIYYADADFTGNWNPDIAGSDKATARSRLGYVILYAGMPLTWGSKLQTENASSATEAEYIALARALREFIPIIGYLEELRNNKFKFNEKENAIV